MGIHEEFETLKRKVEAEEAEKIKIAFFGQPGAGKSSLINAIVGKDVAKVSQKADETTEAGIYEYKDLLLVDLPGYGTSKFPPNKWFSEFKPDEYNLFLCVFNGKFHEADTTFFSDLQAQNRVCLFTRTKLDDIWEPGKSTEQLKADIVKDVQNQVKSKVTVYFTSRKSMEGISDLIDAIHRAVAPAKRDKFIRSVKARTAKHLLEKRAACEDLIVTYAGLAAGNALNPVPVADVAVDFSIMFRLFGKIRETYGLEQRSIEYLAPFVPLANNILTYATQEGLLLLLKRFAAQQAAKQYMKYIPLVGQLIALSLGFLITKGAGDAYLADCHALAEKILQEDIDITGEAAACGGSQSL